MKTECVFTDVDNLLEIFRNNFVRLCEENSVTQSHLAKAVGCTHETISNYQLGITYPNLETLLKIANFFKITPNELINMPAITTSLNERSEQKYFSEKVGLSVEAIDLLYENYKDDALSCENEALDYLIRHDFAYACDLNAPEKFSVLRYLYEAICHPDIKINSNDKELREKLNYYIDEYYLEQRSLKIPVGEFYLQMVNNRINHIVKNLIWKDRKIQRKVKDELRKKPLPSKTAKS